MSVIEIRPAFDLADPSTMTLDLFNPKPKEVLALHAVLEADTRSGEPRPLLSITTSGWVDMTPTLAVELLRRNPAGANRRLDPRKVFYYAGQMAADDWKPTGQPILIDTNGNLADAQHRLYAILISGKTVRMYVIIGIEPGLFAYIDNGGARTAKDALQTAGVNGVAAVIVNTVKFGERVRHGVFDVSTGATRLAPFSPAQIVRLMPNYPDIEKAARSASTDWSNVSDLVNGRKDVVAYVGWRIMEAHGEDRADEFFDDIAYDGEGASDYSVAFRREVDRDNRAEKPMAKQHTAAMLIKIFNAWQCQVALGRRWMPAVNEDFPRLEGDAAPAAAAE